MLKASFFTLVKIWGVKCGQKYAKSAL